MKICPKCGCTDHEPGAKFCHKDGTPLIDNPNPEPPKPEPTKPEPTKPEPPKPKPPKPKPKPRKLKDDDEEDTPQKDTLTDILVNTFLIIGGVLIFIFYAHDKFGWFFGFLYSMFWCVAVPIHFLIWIFSSLIHLIF